MCSIENSKNGRVVSCLASIFLDIIGGVDKARIHVWNMHMISTDT